MKRLKNYDFYINSDDWKQRRDRFFELRFPADTLSYCEHRRKHFVPFEAHHLIYDRLGAELSEDILFVCAKCHRELDRERAYPDREEAALRAASRRVQMIRSFKRPFKVMARRKSKDNGKHGRSFYRHFVRCWRDCCRCSNGEAPRSLSEKPAVVQVCSRFHATSFRAFLVRAL